MSRRRPIFKGVSVKVQTEGGEPGTPYVNLDDTGIELQEGGDNNSDPVKEYTPPTIISSFVHFFTAAPVITLMLVFVPIGIALGATEQSDTIVFVFNFLAIIPLAKLLGESTEQLALHTSQSVGGLLNATFGNAVEIIIAVLALKEGLVRVVQASLVGSILSNLLLVLGMCFVAGGAKYKLLKFNATAAQTSSGILFIAVLAVVVPAALKAEVQDELDQAAAASAASAALANLTDSLDDLFFNETQSADTTHETGLDVNTRLLILSRGTAIVMLIIYGLFLFFQLNTHKEFYADSDGPEEKPEMTLPVAIGMLAVITVIVGVCSEYLVNSIDGVTTAWGISETFAGIVLLPIVGNAAEHLTAVTVAMKNKLDLSIGVAVGSSQQIAMMVIPLLVILGWIIDQPMSLCFDIFETAVLFMTVIVVHSLIMDGESNWLEGAMLMGVYVILGIAFFVV
jgi:Ca2+:H+ antiporter